MDFSFYIYSIMRTFSFYLFFKGEWVGEGKGGERVGGGGIWHIIDNTQGVYVTCLLAYIYVCKYCAR